MNKTALKKTLIILTILLLSLTLGACTGRRIMASGWSGITVKENMAYFSYGPQVYALNTGNGSEQWIFPEEPVTGRDFYAAPVFTDDGNQLIVAGYDGVLYSLNPKTGDEIWKFEDAQDRYIASPLVTDTGIFASSSDNNLYGVDFDGDLLWVFETGDPIWASPAWSVSCECIYLASMDHFLYAIDPENGAQLWKSDDLGGQVVSQPAVSESGLILISTFGNQVIAINEEDHQIEWRFDTADWSWASPTIDEGQVYASDLSGTFYALDLDTGELLWRVQPGGNIVSAPLIKDELVYFGTDTNPESNDSSLVVVSRDGVIQRNQAIAGKLYSSPASNGKTILLAPSEAEFYLIGINQNGDQTWGYPPAK
jgi:outer membrane protein assembly factor BamB